MRIQPTWLAIVFGVLVAGPAYAQDEGAPDGDVIELDEPEAEQTEAEDEPPADPSEPYLEPEEPTEAEKLAARAEQAFVDGDYARAIDLLQQAYDSDQNPNMLYNIARVYEETGDLEKALEFYRRFVVAPNVDLDYRREALLSSEIIEQTLAAQAEAEAEAAAAAQAEAQESDQLPEQNVMLRPAPFPTTSPMRPVGFALAGVGGATVLAGAIVGVVALQKEQDFRDAQSLAERRSTGASARDLATTADALYISGAVLIVTGVVTAFASPRRERIQQLGVSIRTDGVGAAWTVRF